MNAYFRNGSKSSRFHHGGRDLSGLGYSGQHSHRFFTFRDRKCNRRLPDFVLAGR
jgi:hypothetical protein